MSYRLTQFGSVVLPTARIAGTFGTGPTQDAGIQVVGGMFDAYGTGTANLQVPYDQTFSAWLVGTEAATQTALAALMALRGTRNILYRLDEYTTQQTWCWARVTQVRTPWQIQRKTMQPVDVTFQIQTPWYGAVYGSGWSFDSGEYFDDGLFFTEDATFVTDAASYSLTLVNGGNATTRLVSVRVTAAYGALHSLRMQVGDCDWTWTGTLAAGKVLEINGRTMTLTNDSTDAYSGLTLNAAHVSGWWLELAPGNNTVTVTTDIAPPVQLVFDYAEGWA
jgi:hypothetical protein